MTKTLWLPVSLVLVGTATAQTSELFLTDYLHTNVYVVQNGQVVRQFSRTAWNDGPGLVVQSTIKLYGEAWGGIGREYDLNGNLLNGQYPNPFFIDCFDGATDGTRNWTIPANDASVDYAVLVGDKDWNNLQVEFTPQRRSLGIAYDYTDDTFWVTNKSTSVSDRVQHYDTSGHLLGEFAISIDGGGALALDQADQTLWIPGAWATMGKLFQYDKGGNLLQTLTVSGITTNVLGAEFYGVSPFQPYCTANSNSTGSPAELSASGWVSSAAGTLTLESAPVPDQNGIFFHGPNQTQIPFGNGFLCVNGNLDRGTVTLASGNVATYTYDNSDTKHSLGGFVGTTCNFQHWFRDPMGGGSLFNTSSAMSIGILP